MDRVQVQRYVHAIFGGGMRVLLVLCFAILLSFVSADAQRGPTFARDGSGRSIHPAMYVARDADSTLYIFGTMHARRDGSQWGGPEAVRALADASEVWTEIDMSHEPSPDEATEILRSARLPEGRSFSDFLTRDQDTQVRAALARNNMSLASYAPYRPWYVAIMLQLAPLQQGGYQGAAGADRQITAQTEQRGVTRRFFETAEQQMGMFSALSMPVQIDLLMESVSDASPEGVAELSLMERAWEDGDVRALQRYVIDETREQYPELYDVLFVRRNRAWVDVLVDEVDNHAGVDFVAVGAGHLLGPDGLVEMLRARGVSVERVRTQ